MNDDVDSLMAIMAAAFEPYYGEAWTRRQIEDALIIGNCHYLLVNENGHAVGNRETAAGFALSRTGYEEEELLLFAVLPNCRRKGIGSTLLTQLCSAAKIRGARRLLLEMRQGNPAEALYRSFGFQSIGKRPDYYRMQDGSRCDAITFACDII